jgi:hypothetical protein
MDKDKLAIAALSVVLILSFAFNFFLGKKLVNYRIETAYWDGARVASLYEQCRGYTPYTADLTQLENSNVSNCMDISLLVKNHPPGPTEPKYDEFTEAVGGQ